MNDEGQRRAYNPSGEIIAPGQLRSLIRERTKSGLASGALQSIQTSQEFISQAGASFLVRSVSSLSRKDDSRLKAAGQTKRNPFLPYDRQLYLGDLSPSHVALLNKYNVVSDHLLMVTRAFRSQRELLLLDDLEAAWSCLSQLDGLVFYNGGEEAGASQPHKHLQLVPLPLAESGPSLPIEPLLPEPPEDGRPILCSELPFTIAVARSPWSSGSGPAQTGELARVSQQIYRHMLDLVGLSALEDDMQSGPYNLLLSRKWMVLVPRSVESVEGISLNSLAYAGALLVRTRTQIDQLRRMGVLGVLASAAIATGRSSSPPPER